MWLEVSDRATSNYFWMISWDTYLVQSCCPTIKSAEQIVPGGLVQNNNSMPYFMVKYLNPFRPK